MDVATAPDAGPMTCTVCGRSSTLRDAFKQGRDGTVSRTWCPLCLARHEDKYQKIMLGLVVFVAIMMPIAYSDATPSLINSIMAILSSAYVTVILMALPHELGHALVGHWVGFTPVAVLVGEGKPLLDRHVFGVRLKIGRGLQGGVTYLDVREAPNFKARMIAALAAGPAVNLVAAGAAFLVLRLSDDLSLLMRLTLIGFGVGNLALMAMNLWPRAGRSPGGWVVSDGAQILGQIVDHPVDLREHRAAIHMLRATLAYYDREFENAKHETAAALTLSDRPEQQAEVLALRAEAFSESGAPRTALELLEPMLARTDIPDGWRCHLDQAHVWAALLCDESVLLEDALARITRCAELVPWGEVVLIKRICVLAVTAAANPERLSEARQGLEQLKGFKLAGESVGYASLARGLVAAAGNDPAQACAEYNAAKKASVSATALAVLERRCKSLNPLEAQ